MSRKRHAEIAGAGFAGLTAAIALRQRGWTVRIHETSPVLREFGAGIFIWDNGLLVLKAIGAYDDVMSGAHEAEFFETRSGGDTVSKIPFGAAVGRRMATMTRQNLYAPVLAAAQREGVDIITSSRAVGASPDGELRTKDGKTFKADLIVGADGVKSAVRESLQMPAERRMYQDGVIRLLAERLAHMRGGAWDHILDFWSAEEKGLRILYAPCSRDEVYLNLMVPCSNDAGCEIPVNKDVWIKAIPELACIVSTLGRQGRYDRYEMTKVKSWSAGSVALVGDSASAMPPTLGQGAGCAMMNALSLAVMVGDADDIPAALKVWEERERWLTDDTQRKACKIADERLLRHGETFLPGSDALATARHIPTGTAQAASL